MDYSIFIQTLFPWPLWYHTPSCPPTMLVSLSHSPLLVSSPSPLLNVGVPYGPVLCPLLTPHSPPCDLIQQVSNLHVQSRPHFLSMGPLTYWSTWHLLRCVTSLSLLQYPKLKSTSPPEICNSSDTCWACIWHLHSPYCKSQTPEGITISSFLITHF